MLMGVKTNMQNDELKFYGEHEITPSQQNINDIEQHFCRRRKLYRQCGVPLRAFQGADILEVGPGRGDNTLAFFEWMNVRGGAGHVDLVEANPQSVKDMQMSFDARGIEHDWYTIHQCMIEDFIPNKKFDIIIAEGFLPIVENQEEIVQKIKQMISSQGIVVITCSDDVGMFIEGIKRLIGNVLTSDIKDFETKVDALVKLFEPQLQSLRGMSRTVKSWVVDQILGYSGINGQELNMIEAIKLFGDDFYVLGSSPMMFTDYSWYKDIWFVQDYCKQFGQKRLSLLMAGMPEVIWDLEAADALVKDFKMAKRLAAAYERNPDKMIMLQMKSLFQTMAPKLEGFNDDFRKVFYEIQLLLDDIMQGAPDMTKYPNFFRAFGRSMQYLAFEKK